MLQLTPETGALLFKTELRENSMSIMETCMEESTYKLKILLYINPKQLKDLWKS